MNTILIVGGAGYIGSHMSLYLHDKGHDVVILDDLSCGHKNAIKNLPFVQGCVGNESCLDTIFNSYKIDTVMHFASFIEVGESVCSPGKYYTNNVARTVTLLNKMIEHNVKRFIFSSTAATFGSPHYTPIDENHAQKPINPYGRTKLIVEQMLEDYQHAHNLQYGILRYFNAAGASDKHMIGECHDPETHLIPLVLQAASGRKNHVSIFGNDYDTEDGSCVRDFLHVDDICDAHVKLLTYMQQGGKETSFNLGTGQGQSVLDIIKKAQNITGKNIPTILEPRRIGDPAILVADGTKARNILKWEHQKSDIDTIIRTAWKWEQHLSNTLNNIQTTKPILVS